MQPVRSFCHTMAKPSSSVCNLDCDYCFYLEKEHLYPSKDRQWKMSEETLEIYIRQQIEAQHGDQVTFAWQGGEPTLMGLEFFELAMTLQKKHAGNKTVHNTIQTNGIKLNDKWCAFLKKHRFLVGLSIDGPQALHDCYRKTRSGKGTHKQVEQAAKLLVKHNIDFNTLTVVSANNVEHPEKVYQYLKSIGSRYMQFIPLVERRESAPTKDGLTLLSPDLSQKAEVTEWSVPSLAYGQFLSRIFDQWLKADIGQVFIPFFEGVLMAWCGGVSSMCSHAPSCGSAFALESNGDLYACDHYVFPEYKLGNIHQTSINEMNQSTENIEFGVSKFETLCKDCQNCKYKFACWGDCPKHRFVTSSSGKPDKSYLCEGFKHFFKHSEFAMQVLKQRLNPGY